ncbi:Similar to CNBD2: Cyclic nucleotide-binding domain-containing protein 2 (Homo sapiens) [Cotesia congregata]|uniref:Similar to CNBD2: Cyclic nucleotide-binding domain-containing protein 2 (Homo sapiens) n=1 Tax=Cotesia congregata TaxID=51543 RepID=A0A8J2H620_COTCN|nr:Similar to CNBD2: Cyclic nucleotide-binding domain-containing protein 2 (Homo sapiens) [Cotesia congregata]
MNQKKATVKESFSYVQLKKKKPVGYPDKERQLIARVVYYKRFNAQRVIVKQNHPAEFMYFIVQGEVELSKIEKDYITGDMKEIHTGILGPGDIFGEVALLHSILRSTTIITKTAVDLICLHKTDFDRLLKNILLQNWTILQDALVNFNYFKSWDDTTVRECCILSHTQCLRPKSISK